MAPLSSVEAVVREAMPIVGTQPTTMSYGTNLVHRLGLLRFPLGCHGTRHHGALAEIGSGFLNPDDLVATSSWKISIAMVVTRRH